MTGIDWHWLHEQPLSKRKAIAFKALELIQKKKKVNAIASALKQESCMPLNSAV